MTRFTLDSDNLFIDSINTNELRLWKVYNIYEPWASATNFSTHFKSLYASHGDELEVFNVIIKGTHLYHLIGELKRYYPLSTNREGCMYVYAGHPYYYYRVNDFFGWSKYGVYPPRRLGWNKLEIDSKCMVVDLTQNDRLLAEYKQKLDLKQKELDEYKKKKEKELKDAKDQLVVEQNKGNAFKAALKCLVTLLHDFHIAIKKDLDFGIMLPTIRDKRRINSLIACGGHDVTVSRISTTILQVVEEEYK